MTISTLAIDTCRSALNIGLSVGDHVYIHQEEIGVGHAEHMPPAVRRLCIEGGVAPASIDTIIVTTGPGSFMGVRVGVSFAAGFALSQGASTIGISTFDAIWLGREGNKGAVILDARRGQVYAQAFERGVQHAPFVADIDEARRQLDAFAGDTLVGGGVHLVFPDKAAQGEGEISVIKMLEAAKNRQPNALAPVYLRPPDAKPSLPKRAGS